MNIFDSTGNVNEQGLRPTIKKTTSIMSDQDQQQSEIRKRPLLEKVIDLMKEEEKEEKKVEFAFDVDELNKHSFLNKLSGTVKNVHEYQSFLGADEGGRKMKMQGVMSKDCRIDIRQHFQKPDYVAEKQAEEFEKQKKADEREAKTTVGAVKRLIEKVGNFSTTNNLDLDNKSMNSKKAKRMHTVMPKKRGRSSSPDSPLSMKPKIARAKTFSRNSFLDQMRQPSEDKDDAKTVENDA